MKVRLLLAMTVESLYPWCVGYRYGVLEYGLGTRFVESLV